MPPEKHHEMRGAVRADSGQSEQVRRDLVVGKITLGAERLDSEGSRNEARRERVEVSAPVPGANGLPIEGLGSRRHRLRSRERMSAGRRSLTELLHERIDHAHGRAPGDIRCAGSPTRPRSSARPHDVTGEVPVSLRC